MVLYIASSINNNNIDFYLAHNHESISMRCIYSTWTCVLRTPYMTVLGLFRTITFY